MHQPPFPFGFGILVVSSMLHFFSFIGAVFSFQQAVYCYCGGGRRRNRQSLCMFPTRSTPPYMTTQSAVLGVTTVSARSSPACARPCFSLLLLLLLALVVVVVVVWVSAAGSAGGCGLLSMACCSPPTTAPNIGVTSFTSALRAGVPPCDLLLVLPPLVVLVLSVSTATSKSPFKAEQHHTHTYTHTYTHTHTHTHTHATAKL